MNNSIKKSQRITTKNFRLYIANLLSYIFLAAFICSSFFILNMPKNISRTTLSALPVLFETPIGCFIISMFFFMTNKLTVVTIEMQIMIDELKELQNK